jgi:sugar phosphate isomerase/epimerase
LRSRDLKLYSLYLKLDLDREQAYDDALPALLHNHGDQLHYLWFHVHSQRFGKSDPAGDKRCVELLRELAALAKPHGVKIGIYHHVGFWAERFRDAVRVARKVKRENVGAVFNLCHYLRTAGPETLESELRAAFPHLMLASINGADRGDTRNMKWDRLIQPLGDGSFDVGRVLTVLKQQQYRGPIGLQGYGISERPETFFPRSVAAYHRLLRQVNAPE